jgi:hypothetical protein
MQALLTGRGYIRCGFVKHLDEGDPEVFYRKQVW